MNKTNYRFSIFWAAIALNLVLVGCDGQETQNSSSAASSNTITTEAIAVIDGFTATNEEIATGSSTTLTALFRNGTGTINQNIGNLTSGSPIIVSPAETTTYTLTVTGGGKTVTRDLVITITNHIDANQALGSFSKAASLNTSRTEHTATLLNNGKVLIVGGTEIDGVGSGDGVLRTTAELYDPQSGNFINTGNLDKELTGHTATLLPNGSVLIAGGRKSYGEASTKAFIYEPGTGKFKATGNLIAARSAHTATLLANGKVLIAGGTGNISPEDGSFAQLSSMELYDPDSEKFTLAKGHLILARSGHATTTLPNGKVLISGGSDKITDSIELYDPQSSTSTGLGSPVTLHINHTATLLKDGRVLIVGGNTSRAEIYDPASGKSDEINRLSAERTSHTATLLPSGDVLIMGGYNNATGTLSSVVLYDHQTNTLNQIDELPAIINQTETRLYTRRRHHTATMLQNGKILIVGGDDHFSTFANGVLYDPTIPNQKTLEQSATK